jgi:hypothetical protein
MSAIRSRITRPGLTALAVFLISFVVFASLTQRFSNIMGWPTGDEPYYLLIAHSIIHDHDIELTNNFNNKDYWHYYPGELYPLHEAKTIVPGLYSKHAPGVSVIIAPAYALDDWRGTIYLYNFFGALLAANIYLLAYEISRKQWVALLLWLTLSFTNPLMSYTFLIFPALISALMTVYAFRRIRLDGKVAPLTANGPIRMFFIGICLGGMPWLHARFLPISFVLFAYLVWREVTARRRARASAQASAPGPAEQSTDVSAPAAAPAGPRFVQGWAIVTRLAAFFVPAVICAVLLLAYFKILYGTFLPNYSDHAGMGSPGEWVVAIFGSFLDQQWGLFIYAPVLILAIAGFIWMIRQRKREDLFWIAATSIPYAIVIITYKQWWGEWCPAARYWVSLVPLMAVPLAYLLSAPLRRRFWLLYGLLGGLSWAIMAIFMYEPHVMYNHPTGSSHLFEWLVHGEALQPLVPTYFRPEWINVWLTIIYVELVIFIVWLALRQIKQPKLPT